MKKKWTKAELLELRMKNAERRSEILKDIEDENGEERELTEEELAELEKLRNEAAIIQARIDELEAKAQMQAEEDERELEEGEEGIEDPAQRKYTRVKVGETRRLKNPITQLLRGALTGNYSEEVKAYAMRGEEMHKRSSLAVSNNSVYLPVESRATIQATVANQGKEAIATDMLNILDPVRDNLVVSKAGATILTGLVGNLDIPDYSGTTAKWAGEVEKATDGAGKFTSKQLAPKRLSSIINVSKQMLLQDSAGVESMLTRDIVASISTKLESTIFGQAKGTATMPAGLFSMKAAAGAVSDYDTLIDLYTKLRNNLFWGGSIKAVTNPTGYGLLAKTPIKPNVAQGFLVDGDMLATGQEIFDTTAVAEGLIIGDFTHFIVGQWGAVELKVDDTTRFDEGLVRIMVNSYWDYNFRNDKAFEWGTLSAGASTGE